MAVTYDAVGPSSTGQGQLSTTTISWSHTCSGSNRLLTVGVGVGFGTSDNTLAVTYNGVAMTSAGRVMSNGQNDGFVELFYLVAPATGANTVQVTCSASKDLTGGSTSFNGVDQTTPISNTTTNYGSSAAPTITIASNYGDMVVDALCNGSNINSSDQEMVWRRNLATTSAAGNSAQSYAIGRASVTTTYSVSSDWWGIIAVNLNAAPVANKPRAIATYSAGFTTITSPKTVSVTTQAGDIVVVYGGGEYEGVLLGTPSGNGITFTLQQSIVAGNFATAYMWTGTDTVGGTNWTLSVAAPGSSVWGFGAIVFRNAVVGASAKANAESTVSLDVTTTSDYSAVVVFNTDWNANDGSTRVWRTVNGVTPTAANLMEAAYGYVNGAYTAYAAFYPDSGTTGTKTVGLTDPGGQKFSLIGLEIAAASIYVPTTAPIAWFNLSGGPSLRVTAASSANLVNSLGVTIPASTQVGDLLILIVGQASNSATLFNAVSGWTKQGEQRAGGAAFTIAIYTRLAQSGDAGTTVTSTSVNVENYTAQIRVYSGVNQTVPLDATVVFGQADPAVASASAPAITVASPNTRIVTVYGVPTTAGVTQTDADWTGAYGFGNEVSSSSTSGSTNNASVVAYDRGGFSAGSQGPFTATNTDTRRWATATIAIRADTPLISDTFSSVTYGSWWANQPGSISGGRLQFTTLSSYAHNITSAQSYNFVGRSVTVQTPVVPTAVSGEAWMEVITDGSGNGVMIGKANDSMAMRIVNAGVYDDTYVLYNAMGHLWWRITYDGTTLRWQTSPEGTTWTTLRSATSGFPSLTSVTIELSAGHYNAAEPDEPVAFDNFTLA